MDAAEHVVKSRADIRKVIQDFDTTSNKKSSSLFGNGKVPTATGSINMYQDLNDDGSAFVMNVEMNKSLEIEAQKATATSITKSSKNIVNKTPASSSGTKKANKKKK